MKKKDPSIPCPKCHLYHLKSYLKIYGGMCVSCAVKMDKEKEVLKHN